MPNIFLLSDINLSFLRDILKKYNTHFNQVDTNVMSDFNSYLYSDEAFLPNAFKASEILFIWPSPNSLSTEFCNILDFEEFNIEKFLSDINLYAEKIKDLSMSKKLIFLPLLTSFSNQSNIGIGNMKKGIGKEYYIRKANNTICNLLENIENIFLIDPSELFAEVTKVFDNKLWLKAKIPFSIEFHQQLTKFLIRGIDTINFKNKKMLILDLDNTLWGGILGDDGWNNIKIGGHDYVGEAFLQFQIEIKKILKRGILLAICSKNNQKLVEEAFQKNEYIHLKLSDFCVIKANWENKAENIVQIAKDANILLDSIVFIDDSIHERELIRKLLPEIYVPDFPKDISKLSSWFNQLNCFNTLNITKEDKVRNKSIKNNINIRSAKGDNFNEWLRDLNIQVRITKILLTDLKRCLQLINKTNQMNAFTNRYNEKEFDNLLSSNNIHYFKVVVEDRLFSREIMGIIGIEEFKDSINMIEFILSCRAFGKNIEHTMIEALKLYSNKSKKLINPITVKPNKKNIVCQDFFKNISLSGKLKSKKLNNSNLYFNDLLTTLHFNSD